MITKTTEEPSDVNSLPADLTDKLVKEWQRDQGCITIDPSKLYSEPYILSCLTPKNGRKKEIEQDNDQGSADNVQILDREMIPYAPR